MCSQINNSSTLPCFYRSTCFLVEDSSEPADWREKEEEEQEEEDYGLKDLFALPGGNVLLCLHLLSIYYLSFLSLLFIE